MISINKEKLKAIPKMCILEEGKVCDNCCECFVCELDPNKTCDSCARCLKLAEINGIKIEDIRADDIVP
jgi:hypothetical protein